MRKFTHDEAVELLETAFNVAPDSDNESMVEAFVAGIRDDQALDDVNSYIAILPVEIDTDSIKIRPDRLEGSGMDCVFIQISVEG